MGGSSGGIIVRQAAMFSLADPQVHGQLPLTIRSALEPVLKKTPGTWTADDCHVAADAMHWALCNLT